MKKNKLFLNLLACLIVSGCFISCKKDKVVPNPTCRIAAIISGTSATAFTYNSDGKESAKIAATTDKFTYNGNIINITNTTGSVLNTITTVVLNTNGLAASVSVSDASGVNLSSTAFEYDGTELNRAISTSSSVGIPDTTNYTWSGGNMISFENHSNVTVFEYAPDKPAQAGDLWSLLNIVQGFENIRPKNLVTSEGVAGNVPIIISYSFDADGKIAALTSINGGVVQLTINFQYECK